MKMGSDYFDGNCGEDPVWFDHVVCSLCVGVYRDLSIGCGFNILILNERIWTDQWLYLRSF